MSFNRLVKKAKNGDEDSFYKLLDEHKEKLYVIAYSYVGNKEEALDIISESVIKAYTSINNLKNLNYFGSWITKIVINTSIDHYNKNKKIVLLSNTNEVKSESAYSLDEREEAIDLSRAVDGLEEKYRTIIYMKYYCDMTLTQISDLLQIPLGTIKTNLYKALKILKIQLLEEGLS